MNGIYYTKLKTLVDAGRLVVFLVIAPPRSNSSVVEHALSLSPDVDHACHEPFLGARKNGFDSDTGYLQIYNCIGGEEFENSMKQTTIVVKEMAHWISVNNEYINLIELTNSPIVFLIRNPLLTVESRIKRVLKTLNMRPGLSLQQSLLDDYVQNKGYKNTFELFTYDSKTIESILQELQQETTSYDDLYYTPLLSLQNNLLNLYSQKAGYADWEDLLDKKLYQELDYRFFDFILRINKNRIIYEEQEFKKLYDIYEYLNLKNYSSVILDTTDIRAEPYIQMYRLCLKLDISFSEDMIEWGEKPVDFHTQQNKEYEKIWYEKLFSSSKLNPPTEVPPVLNMFPDFIKKYLEKVNLPIYVLLALRKTSSSNEKINLNDMKFTIEIEEKNKNLLYNYGLSTGLTPAKDAPITLSCIDPIYAITNDPTLAFNTGFIAKHVKYSQEIAIIANVLNGTATL